MALVEEVYKTSGVPTYTFVRPSEYTRLLVSIRTAGRGLVIEGPSGIGKTSSLVQAIEQLNLAHSMIRTSARKRDDLAIIDNFLQGRTEGILVVDDFHRLSKDRKENIAEMMKTLADEEDNTKKIIIIGINRAGDTLVEFSADLNNRIDTIRFERNPVEKIVELISLGEKALNVSIESKEILAEYSEGSFHIAQILSNEACVQSDIIESSTKDQILITISPEIVKEKVLQDFERLFFDKTRRFAAGPKLRQEGRAPYLHILKWLSESEDWSVYLKQVLAINPNQKASIVQIMQQESIDRFFEENRDFSEIIYFDSSVKFLSIDDPKFMFFLKNIIWNKFAKRVGFSNISFGYKYDVALSFAGSDRHIAEKVYASLAEREIAVFYDYQEQHRILAEVVEEYLGQIYRSESNYVVAIIGSDYPRRVWTKFESDQFKSRFGDNSVIPIWVRPQSATFFDEAYWKGSMEINCNENVDQQIALICDTISKKIAESRDE